MGAEHKPIMVVLDPRTGTPLQPLTDDLDADKLRGLGWGVVEYVPAEQLRGAAEALEKLANPTHAPRDEEAYLLQTEVIRIAQAALDRLGGQSSP